MLKYLSLFLLLINFHLGFTQNPNKVTDKEISKILFQSATSLMNLECDKSLNLAKEALRYAHLNENNELIAKSYNIIGLNFEEFSDFQKAIGFYNSGLKYANRTENDTIKCWLQGNLGNVYCYRNLDFKVGIKHYIKGLAYAHKIKSDHDIMYANLNIASAHFAIGDFTKGIVHLKNAESLVLKSQEIEAKITLHSLYGSYFTYKNDFEKAEQYYKTTLELSNEDKPEMIGGTVLEVYNDIANMYSRKKDFEKAYEYQLKYDVLKDKFYNDDRTNSVKTEGLNVELDEYKRKINQIEIDRDVQTQNLKQTKTVFTLFLVIFIVLLLLLLTFYRTNKFKKKINSELIEANEALFIAKEKAEESNKLKSQFVSTISHELRTPLYGVVGITNMISDEHPELKDSPYLNSLKFSAKYLLALVNDILQINKIEENKIVLEEMTFNVSDEINSIISSLQFIAEKHNNTFVFEFDPEIPEYLIGDKLRLSQIFMNLISNALKFTKNGEVYVSANLSEVQGKINYLTFIIRDNGIGIAEENQEKIFEKFVQVGRKVDDYQGTGLGLSIVIKLIELFNSEIILESKVGVGTSFKFTIGFEADTLKTLHIINDFEVDLSTNEIYSVLVVEDNKINQMVTKRILENNNFKCAIVDDGLLALKLLEQETFDIILMDLNMPVISGFETSKRIRKMGINTPIIALTAFSKEEVTENVISSGMNDIIIKPFEPAKLFDIINDQITKNAG